MGGSFGDPAHRRVGLRGGDRAYDRPHTSVCKDCCETSCFLQGIGGRSYAGDPQAEGEIAFAGRRLNRDAVAVDVDPFSQGEHHRGGRGSHRPHPSIGQVPYPIRAGNSTHGHCSE